MPDKEDEREVRPERFFETDPSAAFELVEEGDDEEEENE